MTTAGFVAFALLLSVLFLVKSGLSGTGIGILFAALALAAIPWYFGTRDRSAEPSQAERVFATAWVWFRRILGVSVGAILILGGVYSALSDAGSRELSSQWIGSGLLILLGIFLIYFGIVGQGANRYDWRDDVALHKENKRRYRWWL